MASFSTPSLCNLPIAFLVFLIYIGHKMKGRSSSPRSHRLVNPVNISLLSMPYCFENKLYIFNSHIKVNLYNPFKRDHIASIFEKLRGSFYV